ncbi:hypothetical protein TNCV_1715791 [Trichonephila clavipes]|nr:hypothetical protein TNCV_1715791 [Trichonephila clavipes]
MSSSLDQKNLRFIVNATLPVWYVRDPYLGLIMQELSLVWIDSERITLKNKKLITYPDNIPSATYASFLMDLIFQYLCLQLSCKKFTGISEAKLTEGISVGSDIRKLMKDNEFETCMTAKEKEV